MPKATLSFNLNDEFEKDAHIRALKADKAYGLLRELVDYFRSIRKYSELPEDKLTVYIEIEDKIRTLLSEYDIDVYGEYR